jgi:tRNA A-37 threonylcarbamoyl transferase component Bud32
MNYDKLANLKYQELKEIAIEIDLPIKRSKSELFNDIKKTFREYEKYKKKIDKYIKLEKLGKKSKDSTTYLVTTNNQNEFAMKTYRKNKSSTKLKKESEFQKSCYDIGISPKIIDVDTVSKFIVMEKLEKHLYNLILEQDKELTRSQQRQIINIYKKLDELKIFHGDVNLLNFMLDKKGKIYIIDFGESKEITNNLCQKLGTNTPNLQIMSLGLALNLQQMGCPPSSFEYLLKYIPEEQLIHFKISKSKQLF